MATSNKTITLDEDMVETVREALLYGLSFLGEFRERRNAWEAREGCKPKLPDALRPIDPMARVDDITIFAEALLYVQHFDRVPGDLK